MNPQTPIDQLPDEQLAAQGWNQYQALEAVTRQAELCRQNIQTIAQELGKRNQARQEAAGKEELAKKTDQEALLDKLMERISKLPPANGKPEVATETKAE